MFHSNCLKNDDDHEFGGISREDCVALLNSFASYVRSYETLAKTRLNEKRPLSLLEWSRCYLPDHFSLAPSPMHQWLSQKLDAAVALRSTKINLLGPRGSAKSTLGTLAYPLREALENREKYIWIISDTASQAMAHLFNIKNELLFNSLLRDEYPFLKKAELLKAKNNVIQLPNNVIIECYGTGQKIRGRRYKQYRPSLIICDDIQNDNHILSAHLRSRTRQWFYSTLLKCGSMNTNILNVATALHPETIALELAKTPDWTTRVFQSLIQPPKNGDLWIQWKNIFCDVEKENSKNDAYSFYLENKNAMDEGAKTLWPQNESLYDLMKMRIECGEQSFLREKQNIPSNKDFCEFSEEYFQDDLWCDHVPENFILRTIALDPSKGKDSTSGDFSAFIIASYLENGTIYIESSIERWGISELIDQSVFLIHHYLPDIFGIEVNQFQELLKMNLETRFKQEKISNISPYPIENHINKTMRIRRLEPYFSSKKIKLIKSCPSNYLLLQQLKSFPIGDHDDGPDALEMAIRMIEKLRHQPQAFQDNLGSRIPLNVV